MNTVGEQRNRIKLTYVITDLEVGGVPLHLYRLATRLPRDRFDIRVISLADEGPVGRQLVAAGIGVQACGARSAADLRALWRLRRLLRAWRPDVLHAMLFHANIACRIIGPVCGVPPRRIICEIQTVEVERKWHLWVDGMTHRLCRFEVGNSPSVIEHLHRRAWIPRHRLRCEWGAIDVAAIASATPADRSALGVADDEKLLLWTGRLDPIKGFEEMLAACVELKASANFKLLLAGQGDYRQTVEELIDKLDLGDRVRLLGRRNDVPNLLKAADIFVFCSRTEGLPNALLEAMAAGLPIVATDVPGCRDLIEHMKTGVLVPARSSAEIARAVRLLLTHKKLSESLGQAASRWVGQHAELVAQVSRWIGVYRAVAQK